MAVLRSETTNQTLIPNLEVAKTFWSRGKGLLGRDVLPQGQALWIWHCNSIHTFFMKFPIDCVFVDRNLKVKAVYKDVKPGRLVFPVWGASSVIEMPAGTLETLQVRIGDQLNVGS